MRAAVEALLGSSADYILKPGDVLYVPRGHPHEAATTGGAEGSLHLTLGMVTEDDARFWLVRNQLHALCEAGKERPTATTASLLHRLLL